MDVTRTANHDNFHTPQGLFNDIHKVLRFTLDVAADSVNHKCPKYYTEETNGLIQSWAGERCWCNEPYSQSSRWFYKARYEAKSGTMIAMLTPVKSERKCWQEVTPHATAWIQVARRVTFPDKGVERYTAKFPTALILFNVTEVEIDQLTFLGEPVIPWRRRFYFQKTAI